HMNIVLKNADEIKNGETIAKHNLVILRGDNIVYISPP
ncbi:MAG TPA: small nuclear ribonucleoprotein, partial [Thermoplasmatales archaeon]|nr:small nuclear ribonucleoprotein [Thermoplasmatales archaeon]